MYIATFLSSFGQNFGATLQPQVPLFYLRRWLLGLRNVKNNGEMEEFMQNQSNNIPETTTTTTFNETDYTPIASDEEKAAKI